MSVVVWADDDALTGLRGLALHLKIAGVTVVARDGFDEALREIEKLCAGGEDVVLLTDVILPRSRTVSALTPFLGVELAKESIEHCVRRVVFLTVVPYDEIACELAQLRRHERQPRVMHIWKVILLDAGELDRLVKALKDDT